MKAIVLTPLQQRLLLELAKGKRMKQIAVERGASTDAERALSKSLLRKLGLRTQFQLGAWAERHGYGLGQGGQVRLITSQPREAVV